MVLRLSNYLAESARLAPDGLDGQDGDHGDGGEGQEPADHDGADGVVVDLMVVHVDLEGRVVKQLQANDDLW